MGNLDEGGTNARVPLDGDEMAEMGSIRPRSFFSMIGTVTGASVMTSLHIRRGTSTRLACADVCSPARAAEAVPAGWSVCDGLRGRPPVLGDLLELSGVPQPVRYRSGPVLPRPAGRFASACYSCLLHVWCAPLARAVRFRSSCTGGSSTIYGVALDPMPIRAHDARRLPDLRRD